jgi:hypothetical protein
MNSKCPYCKENLSIELTAQIIDKVDPQIIEVYGEYVERTRNVAQNQKGIFGGMMKMAAGMSKGTMRMAERGFQIMIENPPMVRILRCMNCKAALSVILPESSSD